MSLSLFESPSPKQQRCLLWISKLAKSDDQTSSIAIFQKAAQHCLSPLFYDTLSKPPTLDYPIQFLQFLCPLDFTPSELLSDLTILGFDESSAGSLCKYILSCIDKLRVVFSDNAHSIGQDTILDAFSWETLLTTSSSTFSTISRPTTRLCLSIKSTVDDSMRREVVEFDENQLNSLISSLENCIKQSESFSLTS